MRQTVRHRNKTTNFSTSCHRRAMRRNKSSFVSILNVESFLDKELQLHMIVIISQIFASTILAEEGNFFLPAPMPNTSSEPSRRSCSAPIILCRRCNTGRDIDGAPNAAAQKKNFSAHHRCACVETFSGPPHHANIRALRRAWPRETNNVPSVPEQLRRIAAARKTFAFLHMRAAAHQDP